ncbi:MAG: DNA-3-methyladenine glycosylase [Nanoarchaeota archaeon]|nr:DNA-3-methyladenine glycosylase [Nanoarchaeota archaeon]MBU1622534.1 DNA-3-methyladenine glycosylase [Nanoarchaeota archaeon]MBU1974286.1 DNA-3-methyladenine glycosylase [Nanoarchaeota archaeon]
MESLPQSFFTQDTLKVAQELLGKIISVKGFLARIVETEAYGQDPASHAFKRTERSNLMYATYGHVYVYLIYGMYNCLNFTTEDEKPGAVLIRAVEPLNNIEQLKLNRKTTKITNLCSGPGKLCQALGINKNLNGLPLGKEVKLFDDGFVVKKIGQSSRVGIKDALELQWRVYIEGNEFVSKVKHV